MTYPIMIDLIFAAVLIAAYLVGRRRGIIKMIWGLFAWIATIALAITLAAPIGNRIENSSYAGNMRSELSQTIASRISGGGAIYEGLTAESIASLTSLPEALASGLSDGLDLSEKAEKTIEAASGELAANAVRLLSKAAGFLLLILLIRIALAILYRVLHIASKLPVINGTNRLLGGFLGIAATLVVIYIILAYIAVFIAGDLGLIIGQTHMVKYFYNNNILLLLCGR